MSEMTWHKGGCHCGAVTFEVLALADVELDECNCTICSKSGYLHLVVSRERFRLLTGADKLTVYQFNTRTAKHLFCSVCGIKSFYIPRSHPDGFSVNFRCLNREEFGEVRVVPSDGLNNWKITTAI